MRTRLFCPAVLILLALPSPAAPQEAPDQPVIRAGTNVVLVNVVAKDKRGKPVDDLRRDDFVTGSSLVERNFERPEKTCVRSVGNKDTQLPALKTLGSVSDDAEGR